MSEHLHPGPHPDADSLNAFVEGVLPEHERLQCLAHLADCDRCREVVYLAQDPQPIPAAAPNPAPVWRPWFAPIPVLGAAVAACLVVAAVWVYLHRTSAAPPAGEIAARSTPVQTAPVSPPIREQAQATPSVTHRAKRESHPAPPRKTFDEDYPGIRLTPPVSKEQASLPPPPQIPSQQLLPSPVLGSSIPPATVVPAEVYDGRGLPLGLSGITGTVSDQSGAIIPGAAVTLHQVGGMSSANAVTDASGKFKVTALPAGRYELQITAPGFQRTSRQIDLPPQQVAVVTSELPVSSLAETVEVTAATPIIAAENASLSADVHRLPSKLPIVTSIANGKIILALDSGGALFLTRNGGKRWKAVKPRWHGKVVELAKPDPPSEANYQLTTDSGADWLSRDGVHWSSGPKK